MNVRLARLAFGGVVALGAGIAINALYLQSNPAALAKAKAKAERLAAKAELERARRLSLDTLDEKRSSNARTGRTRVVTQVARLRQDAATITDAKLNGGNAAGAGRDTVRAIQRELEQRGYQPGLADGISGLVTRAAIMAYEHDQGLPVSGEPDETLLQRIIMGSGQAPAPAHAELPAGGKPHAGQVIRTVQQSLKSLGYHPGIADGVVGDDTARAIREFEMDQGMLATGRVSGHLVAQLARLAGRGRLAVKRK